ncbi:protein of unknown function [Agrobacterium pusense]|uniref:Uncharacterized protein n=1 Tax=Agrobacterium pusense TaxID=648995 RepID=U4PV10_9HYPH|nr:protein of unknown function [Agrobacterium pusense]
MLFNLSLIVLLALDTQNQILRLVQPLIKMP